MRLENEHAARVREVLSGSLKGVLSDLSKLDDEKPLTQMQLQAQAASIKAVLDQDFAEIRVLTDLGMKAAAAAASEVVSRYENELLAAVMDPAAMARLSKSEAKRTVNNLRAALKRMDGSSYMPLSQRVYGTKQLAKGSIDKIVNQALASGWDARRLAKEVRASISPDVAGGISYAANRLARTEINNAYHASSAQRYLDSPIVEMVEWSLSTSHPEGDICDELAKEGPYPKDKVPAKPHPHCYCYITPTLPSQADFLDNLFAGKYDDTEIGDAARITEESVVNMDAKQVKEALEANRLRIMEIKKRVGLEILSDPEYKDIYAQRVLLWKQEADLKKAAKAARAAAKKTPKVAAVRPRAVAPKPAPNPAAKLPKLSALQEMEDPEEMVDLLQDVFGKKSYNGFKVVVDNADFAEDGIGVQMRIIAPNGKDAGFATRVFREDGSVYHDTLELYPEFRGKGFGSAFSKHAEDWYRANNVTQIELHAGLANGPYTWAKAGYSWDDKMARPADGLRARLEQLDSSPDRERLGLADPKSPFTRLLSAMDSGAPISSWPTPAELANYSYKGKNVGKEILSEGADWYGAKRIS